MPSKKILAAVVCIGIILFVAVFLGYQHYTSKKAAMYEKSLFLESQNFGESFDVEKAKSLVTQAPTKTQKDRAKILLAGTLYGARDLANAIPLYKELALDTTASPPIRAQALNDLETIVSVQSPSFYRKYFPEQHFANYLSGTSTIFHVCDSLLKESLSISPTSFANYALANLYTPLLWQAQAAKTKTAVAKQIQGYITAGDTIQDGIYYSDRIKLSRLLQRAIALSASGAVLGTPETTLEKGYEDIFSQQKYLSVTSSNPFEYEIVLRAKLFYAIFLSEQKPLQTEKIKDVLSAFSSVDPQDATLTLHFMYLKRSAGPSLLKSEQMLETISPEWKKFWESLPKEYPKDYYRL